MKRANYLYFLGIVVMAVSLHGCIQPDQASNTTITLNSTLPRDMSDIMRGLGIATDNSGSATGAKRDQMRATILSIVDLYDQSGTPSTWLYAGRFDHTYQEFLNGTLGTSEDIAPSIRKEVVEFPALDQENTLFTPALEQFTQQAQDLGNKPYACILVSDGDVNDPDESRKAAAKLAEQKNLVAVLICPVDNGEVRSRSRRVFSVLGNKLIISSQADMEDGISQFKKMIDTADKNYEASLHTRRKGKN